MACGPDHHGKQFCVEDKSKYVLKQIIVISTHKTEMQIDIHSIGDLHFYN